MHRTHFSAFGYGSLVNRRTLDGGARTTPGRIAGYRRAWRAASSWHGHGVCALSIEPCPDGTTIRGLLVTEPVRRLPALDAREKHYNRHELPAAVFAPDAEAHPHGPVDDTFFLYRASADVNVWGDATNPVWLSYVDTVAQGFHDIWGPDGVEHFVATTDGWWIPIVDDRDAPAYPRAAALTQREKDVVDATLAAAGARRIALADLA